MRYCQLFDYAAVRIKQADDNFDESEEDKETFCNGRKTKEAPRLVMDSAFIRDAQKIVEANPRKSMRAISREMGVSDRTIRLAVREDLGLGWMRWPRGGPSRALLLVTFPRWCRHDFGERVPALVS